MFSFDGGGFKASVSKNGGQRPEHWGWKRPSGFMSLQKLGTLLMEQEGDRTFCHRVRFSCTRPSGNVFPVRIEGRWRRVALVQWHHLLSFSNAIQSQRTQRNSKEKEHKENKLCLRRSVPVKDFLIAPLLPQASTSLAQLLNHSVN